MSDRFEEFKQKYTKQLEEHTCYKNRACKNPRREHVVLLDGKRVSLNGKATWTAKAYADRAVDDYLLRRHNQETVWRVIVGDYKASLPEELYPVADAIRKEFAKRIQVIPLMDYMVMQSKLSVNKQ